MTKTIKLFIPGPVEVSAKTFAAMATPMIGHRSGDFKNLYREIHPRLQTLFQTSNKSIYPPLPPGGSWKAQFGIW